MITFKSEAYENIMYFDEVAKNLLSLMGHSGTVPGALKAAEVSRALANLQKHLSVQPQSISEKDNDDGELAIGLNKRAIPLINMLQAAVKKNCDVLWE